MSKPHSSELLNAITTNKPVLIAKHLKANFVTEKGIEFAKVIENGYNLKSMTTEFSELHTIVCITALFSDLLNYFNVKSNLTESQIDYFVYEFYENYTRGLHDDPSYTIEDVALFCQQAKSGKFGKVYNSLDGSILNEWIAIFDRERYEIYQRHLLQAEKIQSEKEREITTPPSEETVAKFRAKFKEVANTLGQPIIDENERMRRQKERVENKKKLFYGADFENAEQKMKEAVINSLNSERRG